VPTGCQRKGEDLLGGKGKNYSEEGGRTAKSFNSMQELYQPEYLSLTNDHPNSYKDCIKIDKKTFV